MDGLTSVQVSFFYVISNFSQVELLIFLSVVKTILLHTKLRETSMKRSLATFKAASNGAACSGIGTLHTLATSFTET